jgi:hypothetical protein
MGMLLKKIKGRYAGIKDLDMYEEALKRLHKLGLLHENVNRSEGVNRYNFIVTKYKRYISLVL